MNTAIQASGQRSTLTIKTLISTYQPTTEAILRAKYSLIKTVSSEAAIKSLTSKQTRILICTDVAFAQGILNQGISYNRINKYSNLITTNNRQ